MAAATTRPPATWIARLTVLALLWAALVGPPPVLAGDAELAKFLLQAGKDALAKGNAADAFTKLEKAREEDPTLLEVAYWIGAALEARGDTPGAVESYRVFLGGLGAAGAAEPTKEVLALQKKAQARIDVLDAARRDIERAHEAFAAQVFALAERVAETDANLAERALRLLLAVSPENAKARDLLAVVASGSGAAPTSAALRGLPEVLDLIASHGLGKSDDWTYGTNTLEVRQGKGAIHRTPDGYDSGPTYAMETELELHSVTLADRVSVAGLSFGWGADDGYTLILVNSELQLGTVGKRGKMQLERVPVPAWQTGKRRTVAVRVEGRRVTGYVDGRPLIKKEFDAGTPLGGDVGLVFENVNLTVHRLVLARPTAGAK